MVKAAKIERTASNFRNLANYNGLSFAGRFCGIIGRERFLSIFI